MSDFGLEVWDENGNISFSETGRYSRVLDVFNPASVGIPGTKSYPSNFGNIQATIKQGGGRVLRLNVSGSEVSWAYADNLQWPEMGGTPQISITQMVNE